MIETPQGTAGVSIPSTPFSTSPEATPSTALASAAWTFPTDDESESVFDVAAETERNNEVIAAEAEGSLLNEEFSSQVDWLIAI